MPHIVVEYSAALDGRHDLHALCETLYSAARDCGVFSEPGAIKVRALPCPYWVLGGDHAEFVHVTVWLLPGRDAEQRRRVTHALLEALKVALPAVGSLSVDLHDLDPSYVKRSL